MLGINYSDSSDEEDTQAEIKTFIKPLSNINTSDKSEATPGIERQIVIPLENTFLRTKPGSLFSTVPAPKTELVASKKRKRKKSGKKKRKKSKQVVEQAKVPKKQLSAKEVFLSSLPKPVVAIPQKSEDVIDEVKEPSEEDESFSLLGRHSKLKQRGENDSKPIGLGEFGLDDIVEVDDVDDGSVLPFETVEHVDPTEAYGAAFVNAKSSKFNPKNLASLDTRPTATVDYEPQQSPSPPPGEPIKLSEESGIKVPYWAKAMKNDDGLVNIHSNEVQDPKRWQPDLEDMELKKMHRDQTKKFAVPVYNPSTGKAQKAFVPKNSHKRKHQINTLAMEFQAKQIELIRRRGQEFKNKRTTAKKYGW